LVILIGVIVIDLFFKEIAEEYKFYLGLIDSFIILVFIIDLGFKFNRTRNIPKFIGKYWLEIIAVFPFYLIFRLLEVTFGFLELSGIIRESQNIFHSSVEIEKEVSLISKEAKEIEKVGIESEKIITRSRALPNVFRSIQRTPRLLEAVEFYEEPKHKKKMIAFEKKELRKVKKYVKSEKKKLKKFEKKELKNLKKLL